MNSSKRMLAAPARLLFAAATLCSLAACGGGGDSPAPTPAPTPTPTPTPGFPTSGYYVFGLTAAGTSSQQQLGLQFTHPSQPSKSFTVENPTSSLQGLETMTSGSFNAATKQVANLQSTTVLYAKGNSYYRASLQANGQAPAATEIFNTAVALCPDQTQYMDDYQTSANSALIVVYKRTATSSCTSDSGVNIAVLYPLQSNPGSVASRVGGLGTLVRSTATGGIGGQLVLRDSGQVDFYPDIKAATFETLAPASAGRKILDSAPDSVLLASTANIEIAKTASPRSLQTVTARLSSASTFMTAGTDDTGYYIAENGAGTWRLLRISYAGESSTLASSLGYVQSADSTDSRVVLTISANSASATASLNSVPKAGGAASVLIQANQNELVTGLAGANDYIMAWGFNVQTAASFVRILNASGTAVLSYPSAFVVGGTPPSTKSIYSTREIASFIYGTGYALPGLLANGQIVYFNTGTGQSINLGGLSGFGSDVVTLLQGDFSGTFGALTAVRLNGTSVVTTPIFSVDVSRANSLVATAP
jgi:hypothetical protein